MSRPFEFNGIPVKTPDTFNPAMATTSTADSDRTQDLVMHNSPMGTIQSYNFEWRYIEPNEAAKIIQQVKNRKEYTLRYLRFDTGMWTTGQFYSANYDGGSLTVVNGKFVWESLSFQATGIYPI